MQSGERAVIVFHYSQDSERNRRRGQPPIADRRGRDRAIVVGAESEVIAIGRSTVLEICPFWRSVPQNR